MGVYPFSLKTDRRNPYQIYTKMISSMLSNNTVNVAYGMSHILSRIDYDKLRGGLSRASRSSEPLSIVLFEYVHSTVYDTIAEMERIPGTTQFIHNFLEKDEVKNILKALFVSQANMKVYTRRKTDGEELTKYRQVILRVLPGPPSPIIDVEDLDSVDEYFELDRSDDNP